MSSKDKKMNIELTPEQIEQVGFTPEQIEKLQSLVKPGVNTLETEEAMRKKVGELLSLIRVRNGLTQREIARKLGYSSANFIHMVERGQSKIPIKKIKDFVKSYEADVKVGIAIIRCYHPDTWRLMLESMMYLADSDLGCVAQGSIDPASIDYDMGSWIEDAVGRLKGG